MKPAAKWRHTGSLLEFSKGPMEGIVLFKEHSSCWRLAFFLRIANLYKFSDPVMWTHTVDASGSAWNQKFCKFKSQHCQWFILQVPELLKFVVSHVPWGKLDVNCRDCVWGKNSQVRFRRRSSTNKKSRQIGLVSVLELVFRVLLVLWLGFYIAANNHWHQFLQWYQTCQWSSGVLSFQIK